MKKTLERRFQRLTDLIEKWDVIGDVPGDKYRNITDQFHRLKEEFYYNINIYKELQDHDLKKNQKKKEELIEKAKTLVNVESIKESELLVRSYQKDWHEIGPSPRETYKEMADEFFGLCRAAFERIQKYYDDIHAQQDENLEKKKALVNRLKEILALEIKNHGTWKKKTDQVLELQKEWKSVGFARKKENEEVWQEFRGLCDLFFDKKKAFYESNKAEQNVNKEKKEKLIEMAKSVADSTDWKTTQAKLISLQQDWKKIGPAQRSDEHKLWLAFRAACDKFFDAKKAHFEGMDERQEVNLKAKLALIDELEKYTLTGNKNEDLEKLRAFSKQWQEIGYIPKNALQETFEKYNKAMDGKYEKMNLERAEKSLLSYKQRIEGMRGAADADRQLNKEKYLLRDKIDRLKQRIIQYENNMEIFTGKGAEAMKKDIEKKIKSASREIDEIKKKLDMI